MKQVNIGDEFIGGMFNIKYKVVKLNKTTCWVEHRTNKKIMYAGKWIEEVFVYKNVKLSYVKSRMK
jgi:hypothetical protein